RYRNRSWHRSKWLVDWPRPSSIPRRARKQGVPVCKFVPGEFKTDCANIQPMTMRFLFLIALAMPLISFAEPVSPAPSPSPEATGAPQSSQAVTPSKSVENSVVKVFSTLRAPDPAKPWSKQSPSDISGSGVVIAGKRILTNAHVILYASEVQIQANQAGDKISAH